MNFFTLLSAFDFEAVDLQHSRWRILHSLPPEPQTRDCVHIAWHASIHSHLQATTRLLSLSDPRQVTFCLTYILTDPASFLAYILAFQLQFNMAFCQAEERQSLPDPDSADSLSAVDFGRFWNLDDE